MNTSDNYRSNLFQLMLGTGAFAFCFAVFGSVSAMMPVPKTRFYLTPLQVSIAIAVPVLLGSVGRIPLGLLTDRFGGRRIFTLTMAISVAAAFLMGNVSSYRQLLIFGLLMGISLASFAVGVGFVSGWYSADRQGLALGIYGAGNIGQSLAAFGAPFLFIHLGPRSTFWTFAGALALWLLIFLVMARNAPRSHIGLRPSQSRGSWLLLECSNNGIEPMTVAPVEGLLRCPLVEPGNGIAF